MQPIHPTPVVGMVGLVHDLERVTGLAWRQPGDAVWLLGVPLESGAAEPDDRLGLGGSSYLAVLHELVTGRPPRVDLELERSLQSLLRQAIAEGLISAAHDFSDGGLAVAAAECCIASGLGARLELPASSLRPDRLLFAEGGARVLVAVAPERQQAFSDRLAASGAAPFAQRLGAVSAEAVLRVEQAGTTLLAEPVAALAESFEGGLPRRLQQAPPPPER